MPDSDSESEMTIISNNPPALLIPTTKKTFNFKNTYSINS